MSLKKHGRDWKTEPEEHGKYIMLLRLESILLTDQLSRHIHGLLFNIFPTFLSNYVVENNYIGRVLLNAPLIHPE